MKVAAVFAAIAAMALSVNAEQQASVHLRVSTKGDDICYLSCDEGMHCPKGKHECQYPPKGWCWNIAISEFIESCDHGYYCEEKSNSCQLGSKPDDGHHDSDDSDDSSDKCLNPATGKYIDKCDPGFVCRDGVCDYA